MASNFVRDAEEVGSTFSEDVEAVEARKRDQQSRHERLGQLASSAKASSAVFRAEAALDEGRRQRQNFLSLNAYDRHKKLVNEYFLFFPGSTDQVMQRDCSRDRTDMDVIKDNHKFLWDDQEDQQDLTWEQKLAKKYYNKLFKEYCICDLSRYKDNKVAMRWRTEAELRLGKGQFTCGSRKCEERDKLRTWEVNFAYSEEGLKKNALVKVRLCPDCSYKLNYFHKKKEVTRAKKRDKRKKKKRKKDRKRKHSDSSSSSESESDDGEKKRKAKEEEEKVLDKKAADIWSAPLQVEKERSREEDFSEFLEDLFM